MTSALSYAEFLAQKVVAAPVSGFEIDPDRVNPICKPFQRDSICWGIAGGRRAHFESFGLGKTIIQAETLRIISETMACPGLIVLPLGVRDEFMRDGAMLGIDFRFIRSDAEMVAGRGRQLYLTNYDSVRLGKVTPSKFGVASLDEAAVLRSYGSETFQEFVPLFKSVPYRFVATATPDPNRHKELIHYAAFLGIMDSGQALTRFFQRDSEKAGNLQLYPHKREEFFLWLASWSLWTQHPSDLGDSDDGYDLPALNVRYHEVLATGSEPQVDRDGQVQMFRAPVLSAPDASREKRATLETRIEEARQVVATLPPDEQVVIWCDLNDEQDAVEAMLDGMGVSHSSLRGTQDIDTREQLLRDWRARRTRAFVSKPMMYGAGVNLQQCCQMIFVGVSFKFHDVIQAVHRIWRFLQLRECWVHIFHGEGERSVVEALQGKWAQHKEQAAHMSALLRKYGLDAKKLCDDMRRSISTSRREKKGDGWTMVERDCALELPQMPSNSVKQIITSIPFANHYEYTELYNDFGHTDDNPHFFRQMDYLTPELLRVLEPGRIACIHVKDRILFGSVTGMGTPTVSPFHAECIQHYMAHGFAYMGMITIVTDVVRENASSYRLGWTENCNDSSKMGCGSPEYVLILRKLPTDRSRAYADVRVLKTKETYSRAHWQLDAHALWRDNGNRLLSTEELMRMGPDLLAKVYPQQSAHRVYDFREHVAIGEALEVRGALPSEFMAIAPGSHHPDVWHDINRMVTLNSKQARRCVEKHVCPMQLQTIERLIERYSNPGDLVLDPFAGLGSVPYSALKLGRQGLGIELNPDSYRDALRYCHEAEVQARTPTLFDFLEEPQQVQAVRP